jgi:hypothetical protein
MAAIEVKFVLCRLLSIFGSIELMAKVGEEFVAVDVVDSPLTKTNMTFNTKPASIVWPRSSK